MEHEDFEDKQKPEDFDGFISYAREDLPFVKELIARLASREHRLWIDLEGIYSGEEWWPRICAAIESADAFIFVISPESVASFNCGREVAHAASHRKRILPIRLREVPDDAVPAPVAAHQWIFHDAGDTQATAELIADALEQDPAWHRHHSRLLQRAMDWARTNRASSLLFGADLRAAQEWRQSAAPDAGREPSPILLRFIEASIEGQDARVAQLSRRLAARVLREKDLDPEIGVLLSLAAIREYAPTSMALRALHTSASAFRGRAKLEVPYAVNRLAFSPDGSELAICMAGGTLTIVDTTSGAVIAHMESDADLSKRDLGDVVYSPSGEFLALAATVVRSALVVHRKRQKSVAEFDLGEPVGRVAFSPDGRFLAAHSKSGTTKLWDFETHELWATCRGGGSMGAIAFFPDSQRLVTPSEETEAWVWDISNQGEKTKPLIKLRGHESQIMDITVSRDGGYIVTGSLDGTVRVWHADTGEEQAVIKRGGWIYAAHISPDGKLIGILTEIQIGLTAEGQRRPVGHVEIWDLASQKLLTRLLQRAKLGRAITFSGDWKRAATGGIEAETWIWDARIERGQVSICGPDTVLRHCYCGEDLIAACIIGGELRVFDACSGALRYARSMQWTAGLALAASVDGSRIAVQTTGGVVILETETGREIEKLPIAGSEQIAFTPPGNHLVTRTADRIVIWPIRAPEKYRVLPAEPDFQISFDLSRDGRRILTATPKVVQLWDLESGQELRSVQPGGHEYGDTFAALAPDGTRFAILKGETTGIWSESGRQECELLWGKYNHESEWVCQPTMALFAPCGDRLATATTDGAVLVWDASSGELVQLISLGNDKVAQAAFSASGERIAARAYRDSKITIFDCHSGQRLIEVAHTRAFRTLSKEERVEYELSAPADHENFR